MAPLGDLPKVQGAKAQALAFHARQRRINHAGFLRSFSTHTFRGAAVIAQTPIVTATSFPDRSVPIMFQTRIRIIPNGGVHRGLIFELGGSTRGIAAWVGDQTIGLTAGGSGATAATAIFDAGAVFGDGREFQLVFAINTGSGRIRIYSNGDRISDDISVTAGFGGDWGDANNGSFASAFVGTVAAGVPAASQIAPSGFEVIAPLKVFNGTVPSDFV